MSSKWTSSVCVLAVGAWGLDVTWRTTILCLNWLTFIPERDLTGRRPSVPWWVVWLINMKILCINPIIGGLLYSMSSSYRYLHALFSNSLLLRDPTTIFKLAIYMLKLSVYSDTNLFTYGTNINKLAAVTFFLFHGWSHFNEIASPCANQVSPETILLWHRNCILC